MKTITFDAIRFARDVQDRIRGYGKHTKLLRMTGISAGTFNRLLYDRRVKDYETLVNIAAYLGLDLGQYHHDTRGRSIDRIDVRGQ